MTMSDAIDTRAEEANRQELRRSLREAAVRVEPRDEPAVIDAALARVRALRPQREATLSPERLNRVELLARLVQDKDWVSPPSVKPRVLRALSYFADEAGDGGAGGDPTAMTEMLADDLSHEIAGYGEFCRFRDQLSRRRLASAELREQRLVRRRKRIRAKIQRRRGLSFEIARRAS